METPESIAHYRVVSKLGEGGMGAVYRATDTKLNRDVAVKVLPAGFAADEGRLQRFAREAQVLASLNHPNIAAIYGVEERALVMELVEGTPLRGPLPLDTVLDYARQMAEALEYAHEKGIVHRDLKPANILVTADGMVKLLDFGLAKAMAGEVAGGSGANSPTLTMGATEIGVILGTAGYMAPEQARGKAVDRRADIWAFGVIVWELLTGKAMFAGENASDVMGEVLTREPDLSVVPERVRRLLGQCLQKDPRARLKSIGDWRLLVEEPVVERPRARFPWLPWAVAGVLAVCLAGAVWMGRGSSAATAEVTHVSVLPPEGTKLWQDSANPTAAISPDGRNLAFVAETEGVRHIWIRPMDSTTARQYTGTELADGLWWSPDGRHLVFSAGSSIKSMDAGTGAVKDIVDAQTAIRGAAWHPDGFIVYGSTGGGLMRVSTEGGAATPVLLYDRKLEANQNWPQFLPDGKQFLYWVRGNRPDKTGIYVGSLNSESARNERRFLLSGPRPAMYADGHLLHIRGRRLFAQPFDLRSLQLTGEPVAVTELQTRRDDVSFSSNGTLAVAPRTGSMKTLVIVSRDGKSVEPVGLPGGFHAMRLSPDGKTVAAVQNDEETEAVSIWLTDLSGGAPVPIVQDPSVNVAPVWSPDGRELLFSSSREGGYKTFRKRIGADRAEQRFIDLPVVQTTSDWSSDGKLLALAERFSKAGRRTFIVKATDPLNPVAEIPGKDLRFSPDVRWVAFATTETGISEVYVQALPGGATDLAPKVRVSIGGGMNPAWSADGRELFFNTLDNRLMAAAVNAGNGRVQTGTPKLLFALGGSASYDGAVFWAPLKNGERFAVLRSAPVTARENRINLILNWRTKLGKGN